jgi:amidase
MNEQQAWEWASWDAVETASRVRQGAVTAAEVVEAALLRAASAGPLNAIVTPMFEQARQRASAPLGGPLAGVPTFIKDLNQVAGVRTRWGSAAVGQFVSRTSDPVVKKFESAGLVALGKSATPEFGLMATTESVATGPCRNPWDLARTPGGSSGGAAALVASGIVPLGHGSDGGGSLRIPASCCGLVGLKPSAGRLNMAGAALLPVQIAVEGVLTRTVRDTVAFWQAIELQQPRSHLPTIGAVTLEEGQRLRIGVFVDSPAGTVIDPEVVAATQRAATLCRDLGHEVQTIASPFTTEQLSDFMRLWGFLAFAQTKAGRVLTHNGFDATKLERWSLDIAKYFSSDVRAAFGAIGRLRRFARTWEQLFEGWDVLLCPTLAQPPPLLGHLATDLPFQTLYDRLVAFTPFTALVNASTAPALSLPLGRSAGGLPIGVQFAAAFGREKTLLQLGLALEEASPWPRLAPRPSAA